MYHYAATLEETLEELRQKGATPEAIQYVRDNQGPRLPHLMNALRGNPQMTRTDLDTVQAPQKQKAQYTPLEEAIANTSGGDFKAWALPQLRKLRQAPTPDGSFTYRGFNTPYDLENYFEEIGDWYEAEYNEDPHFKLSSYSLEQARTATEEWHAVMAGEGRGKRYTPFQRNEHGEIEDDRIVYQFEDGWFVTQVNNANDLAVEGNLMNHCVSGYDTEVQSGKARIYSLRDERNRPHVTVEMLGGNENGVVQIKGNSNKRPKYDERERVGEWLQSLGNAYHNEDDPSHETEVEWDSDPDSLVSAIQNSLYGTYYDGDYKDEEYGIGYKIPDEKDLKDFDAYDVYKNCITNLKEPRWIQGTRTPSNENYDASEMYIVPEALVDAAITADIARLQERVKEVESGKPNNPNYIDLSPEGNARWWRNRSSLEELLHEIKENEEVMEGDYRDIHDQPGAEYFSFEAFQKQKKNTLPYGFDAHMFKYMCEHIPDDLRELLYKLTGKASFNMLPSPPGRDLPSEKSGQQSLFRHEENAPQTWDAEPDSPWRYPEKVQALRLLNMARRCDMFGQYGRADRMVNAAAQIMRRMAKLS